MGILLGSNMMDSEGKNHLYRKIEIMRCKAPWSKAARFRSTVEGAWTSHSRIHILKWCAISDIYTPSVTTDTPLTVENFRS